VGELIDLEAWKLKKLINEVEDVIMSLDPIASGPLWMDTATGKVVQLVEIIMKP
jgi:hypothetical protein